MFLTNFFVYLMGHSLADTALQSDIMGRMKSRHNPIDMAKVPKGQKPIHLWYMFLTHHALIHGLIVLLATMFLTNDKNLSIGFAFVEFVSHWIIDFFKCESKYDPNSDQLLHLTVKFIFCLILGYLNLK